MATYNKISSNEIFYGKLDEITHRPISNGIFYKFDTDLSEINFIDKNVIENLIKMFVGNHMKKK